jgi:hypothetical protein
MLEALQFQIGKDTSSSVDFGTRWCPSMLAITFVLKSPPNQESNKRDARQSSKFQQAMSMRICPVMFMNYWHQMFQPVPGALIVRFPLILRTTAQPRFLDYRSKVAISCWFTFSSSNCMCTPSAGGA